MKSNYISSAWNHHDSPILFLLLSKSGVNLGVLTTSPFLLFVKTESQISKSKKYFIKQFRFRSSYHYWTLSRGYSPEEIWKIGLSEVEFRVFPFLSARHFAPLSTVWTPARGIKGFRRHVWGSILCILKALISFIRHWNPVDTSTFAVFWNCYQF